MRHQKKTIKLGRTADHRKALLANQVCSLIEHERIKTTLAKAKAVRPLAEKMVTLGKKGSLHARRTALAVLRQKTAVKKLFDNIAPRSTSRNGGYTRIVRLGPRMSDSASMAFLEWVDAPPATEDKPAEEKSKKDKKEPTVQSETRQETPASAATTEPEEAHAAEEPKPVQEDEAKPKKRKWFGRKSDEKPK
jgi:large subunit ribosomal protein L17